MTSLVESAMTASRSISRYFSVVSMVPAIVAVAWVTSLVAGGAWVGPIRPDRVVHNAGQLGLAGISGLVALALVIGLIVNPSQFTVTQWLEGYWGGGEFATRMAARRINKYRAERRRWARRGREAESRLVYLALGENIADSSEAADELLDRALGKLAVEDGDQLIQLDQISRHGLRLLTNLPAPARMMPTRFGNALRAFEDRAGKQYGLDAVAVAAHLSLLGDNPRAAYVEDTRQTMDLAVRLCMMALLVTPVTAVLLANDGWWLLLTLVPYIVGYLAYRGAVSCAQAYGNAVTFQIDWTGSTCTGR